MIRATSFAGKFVAVFGLGASGTATVRALLAGGATVAAWDDSDASRTAAIDDGVPIVDLTTAQWSQFSTLILAPGVPLTHPEPHWTVAKAKAAGVEIIGDIEIFARERALASLDAPFIAITGTNGKSTTTALVAHILRHAGYDVQMGGNIGRAILTLDAPAPGRFHVVEMSSYQIDLTPTLDATVGVQLNVTPDHLDRHGTIENYAGVKERLVAGARIACVSIDDDMSFEMLKRKTQTGRACAMSARQAIAPGYCLLGSEIVCANREGVAVKLGNLAGLRTLRGSHNAQNAIAAVAAVRECLHELGKSSDIDWQGALASFPGLPHRLEEIGRIGRVIFVNDSKATNADSTEKALLAFPSDVYWIVGGKPKDGGIESLRAYFPGIRSAYLIGAATDEFSKTLDGDVAIVECGTLEVAVVKAAADAAVNTAAEPVVLLSPACASFDQFKNFEVRGEAFRAAVMALPDFAARGRA